MNRPSSPSWYQGRNGGKKKSLRPVKIFMKISRLVLFHQDLINIDQLIGPAALKLRLQSIFQRSQSGATLLTEVDSNPGAAA